MVITQTKKSEMLSDYVTVAHYMLYQEYCSFKKTLVDDSETIVERFLNSIEVQKLIYLFRKQWTESAYHKDLSSKHILVSERELLTYVLNDGIDEVKKYLRYNDKNDWFSV